MKLTGIEVKAFRTVIEAIRTRITADDGYVKTHPLITYLEDYMKSIGMSGETKKATIEILASCNISNCPQKFDCMSVDCIIEKCPLLKMEE